MDGERVPVIVFAKVPEAGTAKSRIAAHSSLSRSMNIYLELLSATARTLRGRDYHVAYTGTPEPGSLVHVFADARGFMAQPEGDLGRRMRHCVESIITPRSTGAICVGCDTPSMTPDDLDSAARLLSSNDVVLGPALDGGYYLAACRPEAVVIFDAIGWSTPDLLDETLSIARHAALRVSLLERRADIDTLDDYHRWKGTDA